MLLSASIGEDPPGVSRRRSMQRMLPARATGYFMYSVASASRPLKHEQTMAVTAKQSSGVLPSTLKACRTISTARFEGILVAMAFTRLRPSFSWAHVSLLGRMVHVAGQKLGVERDGKSLDFLRGTSASNDHVVCNDGLTLFTDPHNQLPCSNGPLTSSMQGALPSTRHICVAILCA